MLPRISREWLSPRSCVCTRVCVRVHTYVRARVRTRMQSEAWRNRETQGERAVSLLGRLGDVQTLRGGRPWTPWRAGPEAERRAGTGSLGGDSGGRGQGARSRGQKAAAGGAATGRSDQPRGQGSLPDPGPPSPPGPTPYLCRQSGRGRPCRTAWICRRGSPPPPRGCAAGASAPEWRGA